MFLTLFSVQCDVCALFIMQRRHKPRDSVVSHFFSNSPLLSYLVRVDGSSSRKYIAVNDNILNAISKITEYFSFNDGMSPVRFDGMLA
jgi:hypothetical protein